MLFIAVDFLLLVIIRISWIATKRLPEERGRVDDSGLTQASRPVFAPRVVSSALRRILRRGEQASPGELAPSQSLPADSENVMGGPSPAYVLSLASRFLSYTLLALLLIFALMVMIKFG